MLAATLKALERDGLLARNSEAPRPHGIGYMLAPLGASVLFAFDAFVSFIMSHWTTIEASRRSFDKRARTADRKSKSTSKRTGRPTAR